MKTHQSLRSACCPALYAISARRNALQQRQAAEQERARQAAEKARQDATVIRIPDEEMQRAQSS